jgi:dTMP kinase
MRRHRGFFISFESTAEGLGKTTQTRHLVNNLKAAGHDVVATREVGGTPVGSKIREIFLDPANDLSKATELFLVMADRAQHYKEVLKPELKAGKIVVSDRFFDSTLVYQGSARGWKTALLWRLHQAAAGALLPDLTIVLDGTPFREQPNNDRFETLGADFFSKVKRGMLHLAGKSERYVLLNANESDETELAQKIHKIVAERMTNYMTESNISHS